MPEMFIRLSQKLGLYCDGDLKYEGNFMHVKQYLSCDQRYQTSIQMEISKKCWLPSQSMCTSSPWCAAESLCTVDGNLSVSCEKILQQIRFCFETNTFFFVISFLVSTFLLQVCLVWFAVLFPSYIASCFICHDQYWKQRGKQRTWNPCH